MPLGLDFCSGAMAKEAQDAASVMLEKTATLATVSAAEVPLENDSTDQGTSSSSESSSCEFGLVDDKSGSRGGSGDGSSSEGMPLDRASPPGLEAYRGVAAALLATSPPTLPLDVVASRNTAVMDNVALSYGTVWSPRKAAGGMSVAPEPILAYGPHGSPKRTAKKQKPFGMKDSPVLCYGPHGSPKRGASKVQESPVLGYGPHGSPKRRTSKAHTAEPPILVYGPHGSPKRRAKKDTTEEPPVFGYGPHGSPKRRADKEPVEPSFMMDSTAAVLTYGPNGSPKKLCQDPSTVKPTLVHSDLPAPAHDILATAKRDAIPLKVNMVSEGLSIVTKSIRSPLKAISEEANIDLVDTPQEPADEAKLASRSFPKETLGPNSYSTTLSASAAEFVPRALKTEFKFSPDAVDFVPGSMPGVQTGAQGAKLSPYAADFVPSTISVATVAAARATSKSLEDADRFQIEEDVADPSSDAMHVESQFTTLNKSQAARCRVANTAISHHNVGEHVEEEFLGVKPAQVAEHYTIKQREAQTHVRPQVGSGEQAPPQDNFVGAFAALGESDEQGRHSKAAPTLSLKSGNAVLETAPMASAGSQDMHDGSDHSATHAEVLRWDRSAGMWVRDMIEIPALESLG